MYAKARSGELKKFTGVDDPYESPVHPEITLDTISHTAEANAQMILNTWSNRASLAPMEGRERIERPKGF